MSRELPKYLPGTALAAAVDAYDNARREFHRRNGSVSITDQSMSDANKNTIAPMIMEAIAAWDRATNGTTDLSGGLLP